MGLAAVRLKHQATCDKDVDPTDVVEHDLELVGQAEADDQHAQDGFLACFGATVDERFEVREPARRAPEDRTDVFFADEAEMQGVVDRCQRVPGMLAEKRLIQRVDEAHPVALRVVWIEELRRPVEHGTLPIPRGQGHTLSRGRAKPRHAVVDVKVRTTRVVREYSVAAER
ncbi:hypothetical protein GCM10022287_20750 [Gryllotalpicola koreensis]|uniref:Uncharacterized protein n=1 Tax=Gryllotalpicola koreensis TaxID=993086 RepID=A0ABP8A145_9MICO